MSCTPQNACRAGNSHAFHVKLPWHPLQVTDAPVAFCLALRWSHHHGDVMPCTEQSLGAFLAPGRMPFANGLHCAWRLEANRNQEPPGRARFPAVIRNTGWVAGFSEFGKVKSVMSLWWFEGTFFCSDLDHSVTLGRLQNQKSLAMLFSNFGPKDWVLLFWWLAAWHWLCSPSLKRKQISLAIYLKYI